MLLTAAAVVMVMSPSLLVGVLPQAWLDAASLKDFPLLKSCTALAGQLIGAVRGQVVPGLAMVTAIAPDGISVDHSGVADSGIFVV